MADDQPFLLPVLIDDTLEVSARVPDRFRERQWTRLPGGETAADFAERVNRLRAGGRVAPDAVRRRWPRAWPRSLAWISTRRDSTNADGVLALAGVS